MIAPMATSSDPSAPPMIATIGIRVSGIAVPTAARMLPVAPSPRFEAMTEPLDRVGEHERPREDHGEAVLRGWRRP